MVLIAKFNNKVKTRLLIIISLILILGSCSEGCYDCFEMDGKLIIVEDDENNNLIFDENPIYEFDSIKLKDKNGNLIHFFENAATKSLQFGLSSNHNICYLHLNAIEIDTISFNLYQKDSESCCGQVTHSSKTFLNNVEIENKTEIIIVK